MKLLEASRLLSNLHFYEKKNRYRMHLSDQYTVNTDDIIQIVLVAVLAVKYSIVYW